MSTLRVGRVLQVFKNAMLKEALRRDSKSKQFLQRRDFRINKTGFAIEAKVGVESRLAKITEHKIKECMQMREGDKEC